MKIVALVTARGGSKGLPRKNILPVAGKPLIAWTIEAAARSSRIDRILLSSDDHEIADVAKAYGAEVPFIRPAELATDSATSYDVAAHALNWLLLEQNELPDYLLLLQPTSPLRTTADIDGAIQLALDRSAEAVLGVSEAQVHPFLTRRITETGVMEDFFDNKVKPTRRQDFPPAYAITGAIYLNSPKSLLTTHSFQPPGALAYVMPPERSLDIDSSLDLKLADFLLSNVPN